MIVSSANRKDKNEIVPCMVDKPINHLLKLLESCTAPLAIITIDLGKSVNYLYAPLAQWQSTWLLTKVS